MTDIYYADDLEPGQLIPLGSYTITEEEIVTYARQWNPVFIHTDPTAAATTPLGGVIASGLHTSAWPCPPSGPVSREGWDAVSRFSSVGRCGRTPH